MITSQVSAHARALGFMVLLVAATGCSGSSQSQSPLAPVGAQSGAARAHGLALVSNTVDVANLYTVSIVPSGGSAICWTVTPPSWPIVAPGTTAGPLTLAFNTLCVPPISALTVNYSPSAAAADYCSFTATYTGAARFSYSVVNHGPTTCKVMPSAIVAVDEYYVFNQTGPAVRRSRR